MQRTRVWRRTPDLDSKQRRKDFGEGHHFTGPFFVSPNLREPHVNRLPPRADALGVVRVIVARQLLQAFHPPRRCTTVSLKSAGTTEPAFLLRVLFAATDRFAGFVILKLDRFPRSRLDDFKYGTHDVFADFQHGRLLLPGLILITHRQEMLPLL